MKYDASAVDDAPMGDFDTRTMYERWIEEQGLPIVRDFYIEDLTAVETAHWDFLGADAAFVELDGATDSNGAYLVRLEGKQATNTRQQVFDEIVYVVSGEGVTEVEMEGGGVAPARWTAGALFSIPLNRRFRHIATDAGAVLYCVNGAPLVMNMFHNQDFVWHNPFDFSDRFDHREDFFSGDGRLIRRPVNGAIWDTNFAHDVVTMDLVDLSNRGAKGRNILIEMAQSSLIGHVSEMPLGRYKKAHRHGPGAHVVMLSGEGYSLLWQDDFEDRVKIDWKPNAVFVPPNMWWHQHFSVSQGPARYLALRWGSKKYKFDHSFDGTSTDKRQGGNQIEYDDEDPRVYDLFAQECAKRGTKVDMDEFRS